MTAARLDLAALAPNHAEPHELARDDARALAHRLVRGVPFARLLGCRRGAQGDLIVMEVGVETPQRTVHDIRMTEPIGVWFAAAPPAPDAPAPPEVFALREDFPADVPHVNLRTYAYPRSLCLYDVAFAEVRSTWTPARFVTLVREWLRLTAIGKLHAADQPLEPLILGGHGWIILPNILREGDAAFGLVRRSEMAGMPVLVAVPPADVEESERQFVVAFVRAAPRTHGVMHRAPVTLADLHDLLAPENDVRAQLAASVRQWKDDGVAMDARVAIVLLVPMRRAEGAEPELDQPWAFLTVQTITEMGESLGLWVSGPLGLGAPVGVATGDGGASVQLLALNAYFEHRREDGARYNGRPGVDDRLFVAVGAGALGSQVLDCAARASFGRWTVVDSDVFLPHNVARHELREQHVGWGKAAAVAVAVMGTAAEDGGLHDWIAADVLTPGGKVVEMERAFDSAVAIVDMSASVAVARTLALDVGAAGRRISLFVNPTGTDLVMLAESSDRSVRLDALEMQYYRAVARDDALAGTLREALSRERYGRSCRDVSRQMPHARLKLLAGLGAQALERAMDAPEAQLRVWRLDEATLGVKSVDIPVHPVREVVVGEWRLVIDAGLLAWLRELRAAKLPSETGGVLLGAVDVARRVVYVADTIPSPPDSKEWPTLYIRGAAGLRAEVDRIHEATGDQLHYVGEWHSHPRGCPPHPSRDDLTVFSWITDVLDADDLPAVMMIVGDDSTAPFVGTIATGAPVVLLRFGGALGGPA